MSVFSDNDLDRVFHGVVSKWFPGRHFGFIVSDNGQEVFLGKHEWPESSDPKINTTVDFCLGRNGKGWAALKCIINMAPSQENIIFDSSKAEKKKKASEKSVSSKLQSKLQSLKKNVKKETQFEGQKAVSSLEELDRFGQLAPKARGTSFFNPQELNTIVQALEFYRAMDSWSHASINVMACRELSVVFVSVMEDFNTHIKEKMFSGLSVSEAASSRAKELWRIISSQPRTFSVVLGMLSEAENTHLTQEDELLTLCFETCIQHHTEMNWIGRAAWILLHSSRSHSVCQDNFLNAFILVNWYLMQIVRVPFPVAFNFDSMSEETNEQLREALTGDDEVMLAIWISKEMSAQWMNYDNLVQHCIAENSTMYSYPPGNIGALKAGAQEDRDKEKEDESAVNQSAPSSSSAREDEDRIHDIIVNHRRSLRADHCFICMDDNIRPTMTLLCCGQPCHIKCMEKWYASKPNFIGREKCPQCTQEIPEPVFAATNTSSNSNPHIPIPNEVLQLRGPPVGAAGHHHHHHHNHHPAHSMHQHPIPVPSRPSNNNNPAGRVDYMSEWLLQDLIQPQARPRTSRSSYQHGPLGSSRRVTLLPPPPLVPSSAAANSSYLLSPAAVAPPSNQQVYQYTYAVTGVPTGNATPALPTPPLMMDTHTHTIPHSAYGAMGTQMHPRLRSMSMPTVEMLLQPSAAVAASSSTEMAGGRNTHNNVTQGLPSGLDMQTPNASRYFDRVMHPYPFFPTAASAAPALAPAPPIPPVNGSQLSAAAPAFHSQLHIHPVPSFTTTTRSRFQPNGHYAQAEAASLPQPIEPSNNPLSSATRERPLRLFSTPSRNQTMSNSNNSSNSNSNSNHHNGSNVENSGHDNSNFTMTEFDQVFASHLPTQSVVISPPSTSTSTSTSTSANLSHITDDHVGRGPTLNLMSANSIGGSAAASNVTVIPLNPRTEELFRQFRSGDPAPAIQPSLHNLPQSPLCQHCGVALRAVECTNFHCGRCCQRVGALNCLRHHRTRVTASGVIVLENPDVEDARPLNGSVIASDDDRNGEDVTENEEDIYDLRPDPELLALPSRVPTSALSTASSAPRPNNESTEELFEFPPLSNLIDEEEEHSQADNEPMTF